MYAIHHILVAIKDPGAKLHPAVANAAVIAVALNVKLLLFHAIDGPVYPHLGAVDGVPVPQIQRRHRDTQQILLERIATPLRRDGASVPTAV